MSKTVQFFPATPIEGEPNKCRVEMPVGGEVITVAAQGSGLLVVALVDHRAPTALHGFWLTPPGLLLEPLLGRKFGAGWMVMAPSPQGPQPLAVIQDLPWPKPKSVLEVN